MPTGKLSIGGSKIPPWIIKGSVSPWKERLHLFYGRIINKELVKYLLLLRKSSKGRSRLHRHLGWKETEGPWGLTYIPCPKHGACLWTRQEPSSAPSTPRGEEVRALKSPEMSSGCSTPKALRQKLCRERSPASSLSWAGWHGPMSLFPPAFESVPRAGEQQGPWGWILEMQNCLAKARKPVT